MNTTVPFEFHEYRFFGLPKNRSAFGPRFLRIQRPFSGTSHLPFVVVPRFFQTLLAQREVQRAEFFAAAGTFAVFNPAGIPFSPLCVDLIPVSFQKMLLMQTVRFFLCFC